MKVSFAKTALVIGLFAGTAFEVNAAAATSDDLIQIGCTVPSSGFGGATVYSLDTAGVTFQQTALVAGTVCSKAINSLTSGSSTVTAAGTADLIASTNIVIPGTGYSLQQFTLQYTTTTAATSYSLVGCTAPAATGGTVYSVDSRKATGGSSNTLIAQSTAIAVGANCVGAIYAATTAYPFAQATTVSTPLTGDATYNLPVSSNVTVSNNGYSLQQFLLQ